MRYMGSKRRLAPFLAPILENARKDGQTYVEPFVGGANLIESIKGKRIGADVNHYVIELFRALQKEITLPLPITAELYSECREVHKTGENPKNIPDYLLGYVGVVGSFRGMFFDVFNGKKASITSEGRSRDYQKEMYNGLMRQAPLLKDVEFIHSDFKYLKIPENSLIYCDPPYRGATEYNTKQEFPHDLFWSWCRVQKSKGHTIFVSEYNAPDDFECVFEKEQRNSMSAQRGKTQAVKIERLFTLN